MWPLLHQAKAGDYKAFREIIERNSRLVYYKVRKWLGKGEKNSVEPMDLVQAGYIGLVRGTLSFNPRRGRSYLTYVKRAIGSYIEKEFYANTPFSRREGKRRMKQKKSVNPTDSLSKIVYKNSEGEPITLEEVLTDNEGYADYLLSKIIAEEFLYLLRDRGQFDTLDWVIIEYSFAVGRWKDREPLTLSEVKEKLNNSISKEGIRKRRNRILSKIRQWLENHQGKK